ncbi:hypothetical protein [Mycobacterium sp. 141]|uniref:hypothetical protein n=1 Tax=Mycobacterium sp. 141 TaxID=1120797 RepID=UPI00036DC7D6|nr:hypothetical protein [Mycobacterium sp. 141]
MLAGVAVAGASVMAITPSAQLAPTLTEIQNRAVQLSAAEGPFSLLQSTLETAAGHVQYGLDLIPTLYPTLALEVADGSPDILAELQTALTNTDGWQQVAADLPGYGTAISDFLQSTLSGLISGDSAGGGLEQLPGVLESVATHLANGEFTEAYAEFNWWALFSLGSSAGWNMQTVAAIPSDILDTLGAPRLARTYEALFGSDALTMYSQAILTPVIGATFQLTEALDEVVAAANDEDWETVSSGLVNLPTKVLRAYFEGYAPSASFDPGVGGWPGLLTKDGTLETLLFTVPRNLTWGLTAPIEQSTEQTQTASTDAASTALPASDKLVTLDVDPAEASTSAAPSKLAASLKALVPSKAAADADVAKAADSAAPAVNTTAVDETKVDETKAGDTTKSAVGASDTSDTNSTDAAKSDAAKSDSAKSDAAKSDAAKSDSAKSDSAKSDSAKSDSTKSGSVKTRAKSDSAKSDAAKSDSAKSDSTKSGSVKTGAKSDSTKSADKAGKAKARSAKTGSESASGKSGGNE